MSYVRRIAFPTYFHNMGGGALQWLDCQLRWRQGGDRLQDTRAPLESNDTRPFVGALVGSL